MKKQNKEGNIISIVGAGFGDEGKGKITDVYASEWADVVVRANGGCNAGHTINVDGTKLVLRALPSGVLNKNIENVICHGCVINLEELINEIDTVNSTIDFELKLHISDRANVITQYDIFMDKCEGKEIKTTGNGIGPCYADKTNRKGLRICDLYKSVEEIETIIRNSSSFKYFLYATTYENVLPDLKYKLTEFAELLHEYGATIKDYVCDTAVLLNDYMKQGKHILFEGSQAAMLDNTYGFYPYVTSSNPTTAGLSVGSGIAPKYFDNNIGVIKSYCTRVGGGPFITEFNGDLATFIREKGHEYGTVTGRPRRIGWFDCVIVKHGHRMNGYRSISLTLLDVLSGIDELKICINYIDKQGNVLDYIPANSDLLNDVKPVYMTVPGWKEDISKCKYYEELPDEAKNYIETIEEQIGIPIDIISVGPDRTQFIR